MHVLADSQSAAAATNPAKPRVWREWELWAVVALVAAIYLSRLTALPVCGEESRWATAASEMLTTGDWIVPRQQGQVFPERPPLGSWAMALVGMVRGQVDAVAIRLPSALATIALAATIYLYGRRFLSRCGALAAALCYATMGQVLQLGGLGESEALFSFLLAASLLVWHAGYLRGRAPALVWCAGYALCALAALIKGPQAPIYFVVVTGALLCWRRDWQWLFSWQHALGLSTFALLVGLWQVPFYLATDRQTVIDIWSGLARDRFELYGLFSHLLKYPLETFGCLLPWSSLLLTYFLPSFRRRLSEHRDLVTFLFIALAVTYPSVWLSAGARGRYFMPLYPCFALLIGLVVDRALAADAALELRRGWKRYLTIIGSVMLIGGMVVLAANWLPLLAAVRQPPLFAYLFALVAATAAAVLLSNPTVGSPQRTAWSLIAMSCFLGLAYSGAVINVRLRTGNDIAPDVAAVREQLFDPAEMVSFGPTAHRFAYFYGAPIRELDWPTDLAQLPEGVEYFCYEEHQGDTTQERRSGRGRVWTTTPGSLPFRWEPVARIPCDPKRRNNPTEAVIVGRIVRDSDHTADRSSGNHGGARRR